MSRILFTTWPFPTHLTPHLTVARALRERNHEVTFYTGPELGSEMERWGFRHFPFENLDWPEVQRTVDRLIAGGRRPMPSTWRHFLVDTVPEQVADLQILLTEWRPHVMVCDIAMWGPLLILHEQFNIPLAMLSHIAVCLAPGPDGAVAGLALPPARSALGRMGVSVLGFLTRLFSHTVPNAASRLRKQYGLPPIRMTVREFSATMPLYLVPSAPEFDYERSDLPSSVYYVGPCLWEEPAPFQGDSSARPLVIVEEGALHAPTPLILKAAVNGLADLPVEVLLVEGKRRTPGSVQLALPPNMHMAPWQVLTGWLSKAEVLVTTGNSESVLAALMADVPLVVVPWLWDQDEVARRVVESGAGLRLSPGRNLPGRLRQAIQQIGRDPSFRQQAKRLHSCLADRGGSRRAAELIERLLDRHAQLNSHLSE